MKGEQEVDDEGPGIDPMLANPPEHLFEVLVGDVPQARIFGEREKRNWVFWKLSEYVLALSGRGNVSVRRYINGKWENNYDWRNAAH